MKMIYAMVRKKKKKQAIKNAVQVEVATFNWVVRVRLEKTIFEQGVESCQEGTLDQERAFSAGGISVSRVTTEK